MSQEYVVVKQYKTKGRGLLKEKLVYRAKNSPSTKTGSENSSEKEERKAAFRDSQDCCTKLDKSSIYEKFDFIPIPKKANLKENYKVYIPKSVKELGIKNRNYSKSEIA